MHQYPFGAIETVESMQSCMGRDLYLVHGVGQNSSLQVAANTRNMHVYRFKVVDYESWRVECNAHGGFFLTDFNIGGHYNSNYVFHEREDAESYLAWARQNTDPVLDLDDDIFML